jgi:hypothetical protein
VAQRIRRSLSVAVALAAGAIFVPAPARAQAQDPGADMSARESLASGRVRSTTRQENGNPFRGSVLILDQSMTTQTAGIGVTPISFVPLYELWLSFRPRYYFDRHWSLRGRFDVTKELTNSQNTTYYQEDVLGDVWTDLVYGTALDSLWRGTKLDVGLRALWPTSKASQANGTYVTAGVRGVVDHVFDLNGDDAPFFDHLHVALGFSYLHPFSATTTPNSFGSFGYARQDVDERSFISDQISGQTLAEHVFWANLTAGVQITPQLAFTGDLVMINEWHYPPTSTSVGTLTGTAVIRTPGSDNQYVQDTWFVANLDYQPMDELSFSLGYYNLANALAPDGSARSVFGGENIWWSPAARLFFDVTANLDVLLDDASGRRYSSQRSQSAHADRVASHLR